MNMLELLDRFERLQLGCLRQNIQAKYEAALQQFMAEIEQLRQVLTYSAVLTVLYAFKPPICVRTYVYMKSDGHGALSASTYTQQATLVACTCALYALLLYSTLYIIHVQ